MKEVFPEMRRIYSLVVLIFAAVFVSGCLTTTYPPVNETNETNTSGTQPNETQYNYPPAIPPSQPNQSIGVPGNQTNQTQAQMQGVYNYSFEADDSGFYFPNGTSASEIEIPVGANVTITLRTRAQNVYYGALDFRSPMSNASSVSSGVSWTVPVIAANDSFTITSCRPSTGTPLADLNIIVVPVSGTSSTNQTTNATNQTSGNIPSPGGY